jgi:hypothetical protein
MTSIPPTGKSRDLGIFAVIPIFHLKASNNLLYKIAEGSHSCSALRKRKTVERIIKLFNAQCEPLLSELL